MNTVLPRRARTRSRLRSFTAVAVIGLVTAGAHAEIVELRLDTDGRMQRQFDVAPAKFVEVCGPLDASQSMRWQFRAAAPLHFNLHYHVGKAVHYPVHQDQVAEGAGSFSAPSRQVYCWMWRNPGTAPVRLDVTLAR